MKTAISIPDQIFKAADRTARRLHISRSHLYSQAVEKFIGEADKSHVTERLNKVYQKDEATSALPADVASLQWRSLPREEW